MTFWARWPLLVITAMVAVAVVEASPHHSNRHHDPGAMNNKKRAITQFEELLIAGLFPLSQNPDSGRLGRGVLPAALLARDHINHRHNLLKGYELQLDVNNTACDAALGIKAFLDMLYKQPGKRLMVFGSACTEVTGPIAQASQFLHLAQLSYADTHPMYNHHKFPNLYRIVPSENQFNYARLELIRHFNWTYIAALYQNEPRYSLAHNHFTARATAVPPPYILTTQDSFTDLKEVVFALDKLQRIGARIIFGSFNETWARVIFCAAYHRNMYGRKYQWIIWGGYNKDWWLTEDVERSNCTSEQLVTALNGYMNTDLMPLSLSNEETIAKLTPKEYESMYVDRMHVERSEQNRFHGYTYDGVWAMAKAISIVMQELPPWDPIDKFEYKSPKWSRRFLEALNNTEFIGVTGPVRFFQNERVGRILINQFQLVDGAQSSASEQIVALFHNDTNFMDFTVGAPIFWHGKFAPRDRTIERHVLVHLNMATFVTMSVLACAGIVLAVSFLVVNIKYRNHKYIKMSSPYLNNIIIFGCIMTYVSVILLGIDRNLLDETQIPAICTARLWVLTIGFTLAFGAMFSKTWRVHAIFTNIKLNKKIIKDYQLFLIVGLLLFLDLVVLTTWQLQDPFTYDKKMLAPWDDTDNDEVIKPQIGFCISENNTIFLGVTYAFKGILMAFGCFLAWETRHVSIPALNDSKYIGMSVYNVVIMCVIGAAISIILTDQQEYAFIIISVFIIFCTTITLCLVFVPKIIELKKNPNPETKRVRATLKPSTKSSKRESFSADLQKRIKTLQDQNAKLKETNRSKVTELDRLVREVGEEAKEILQTRRKTPRTRQVINFQGVGSEEDDDDNSSRESSQASDHWPLVETSAITKCVYVHYRPRKNSAEGATICTTVSEPSSNSHRHGAPINLPPISDADETDHISRVAPPTPGTPTGSIFGGVYVGSAPTPPFKKLLAKKALQAAESRAGGGRQGSPDERITENHLSAEYPISNSTGSGGHLPRNSVYSNSVTSTDMPSISGDGTSSSVSEPGIGELRLAFTESNISNMLKKPIPKSTSLSTTVDNCADKRSSLRCDVIASL